MLPIYIHNNDDDDDIIIIKVLIKHQPLSVLEVHSVLRLTGPHVAVILLISYWCKNYKVWALFLKQ